MKRALIAAGILAVASQAHALTINPTFVSSGDDVWDQTEKNVFLKAIGDWSGRITTSMTINVSVDFTHVGTDGYLGQWEGSGYSARLGDDIRPDFHDIVHTIHFNADLMSGTNFLWFDATPQTSADQPFVAWDALSVARHEIGHMLGFVDNYYIDNIAMPDESVLWDRLIDEATFDPTGLNVSLASVTDLAHVLDAGLTANDLMNPELPNGTRREISEIDLAMLERAYGYSITSVPEPAVGLLTVAAALLTVRRRRSA